MTLLLQLCKSDVRSRLRSTESLEQQTTTTTTPLPALKSTQFPELHGRPQVVGAHEKILRAEARAVHDEANGNVILARVVGYLLLELYARRHIFGDRPFVRVADDVMSSSQDRENIIHDDIVVFEVGQRYRDRLIRPRTFGCPPVLVF